MVTRQPAGTAAVLKNPALWAKVIVTRIHTVLEILFVGQITAVQASPQMEATGQEELTVVLVCLQKLNELQGMVGINTW